MACIRYSLKTKKGMSQRFLSLILLFVTSLIFFTLSSTFFQQDEWHSFGTIQSYGWRYITLDKPVWQLLFNDRAGARIVMFSLFSAFGASGFWFGVFSGLVHTINTFLVFLLANKLLKKTSIAIFSSLLYSVNAVGHQAYSWFGTVAGSATSVTFILSSLLFYFEFLQKRKMRFLIISLFFVYISMLFKESGYFLFILYPILWFLFTKKKTFILFIRDNFLVICYGFVMTLVLAASVFYIPGDRANYVSQSSSGLLKLITHTISYPAEGLVQVFIPPGISFPLSRVLTVLFVPAVTPDTPEFDLFYTTKMVEYVSLGFFGILGILVFLAYKRFGRDRQFRLPFLFSIAFILLSFLPYTVLDKFDGYLDSRYYYPATVGAALLFGAIFSTTKKRLWKIVAFSFLLFHFFFLTTDLFNQVQTGNERKQIINDITTYVPKLKKKTIFYITGNSSGYYALPELKVPFQSGLGQILLVVYGEKGQIDPNLFKEETLLKTLDTGFLYDTLAQGYKETKKQGFGYFYQEGSLRKALESEKFNKSDVISLYYDSDPRTLRRFSR